MKLPKIKIFYKSFFKRGIKKVKDDFAIFLVTGYQGSGKTYFAIQELHNKYHERVIVTNIHSLLIPNRKIIYFKKLNELYSMDDKNAVFVIDEVSKAFTKESKQDRAFYSWLQQYRKHSRYVYLITQEYIQVPTWLRGVANQVFTTRKLFLNLFLTSLGRPVLNDDTKEWETENFMYYIYKRTQTVANSYDTFEPINEL